MYIAIRDCMLPVMGKEDHFEALEALGLDSVELAIGKQAKTSWPAAGGGEFDLASDAAGGVMDGRLFVVGGWDGEQEVAVCEYFDPAAFLMSSIDWHILNSNRCSLFLGLCETQHTASTAPLSNSFSKSHEVSPPDAEFRRHSRSFT